jgi:hypothetical protein
MIERPLNLMQDGPADICRCSNSIEEANMNKLLALVAMGLLGLCTMGCEQPKSTTPPPVVTTPPADKTPDAKPVDAAPTKPAPEGGTVPAETKPNP